MVFILFVIGFFILIKGADLLVSGASSVALKLKITPLVIGLTIVAFGTSTPEFAVNMFSAFDGKTDLAVGNILGSNIANILLVLGVTAVIYPVTAQKTTVFKEIPFALLGVLVLGILANDGLIDGAVTSQLSRIDGLIFLGFFVIFLYYTFGISKQLEDFQNNDEIQQIPIFKSVLFILGGLVGLTLGGKWIVDGAIELAGLIGMSEKVIGLTVVAIGTSLPELATSIVAAFKKQSDIALGNIVGSNIFNIFWILGATGVVSVIPIQQSINIDILVAIGATIILFVSMFLGKKHQVSRLEGGVMVMLYIFYVGYLLVSNLG